MKDPIEGDYRVIGERPRSEPIIKSQRAALIFVLAFLAVVAVRTYLNSEGGLWERSERSAEASAE